jgi:hypothetical protein
MTAATFLIANLKTFLVMDLSLTKSTAGMKMKVAGRRWKALVSAAGFEPATHALKGR